MFPDSPGRWLAWFRLRGHGNGNQRLSPAQVGRILGVSEATVRRWEADLARPRVDDLLRLSKLYEVTPLEEQFLLTAVAAGVTEQPPHPDTFYKEATDALQTDVPTVLVDSLFFIRAWNSYARDMVQPPAIVRPTVHPLAWSLRPAAVEQWDETKEQLSHRAWRRVQEFWLRTAGLCGTEAYRQLVDQLRRASPLFSERWLATDQAPEDLARPIGTTYHINDGRGTYRLVSVPIVLPPTYHLRLYTPDDEQTEAALQREIDHGPRTVHFNPVIHWSLTP